jgi:hypothetical protein
MSTATESAAASAVKVAAVSAGAAMSGMQSVGDAVGITMQQIIWFITISYGVLQIIKCMPWLSFQAYSFYRGVRYNDWSRWVQIAQRSDKDDGGANV